MYQHTAEVHGGVIGRDRGIYDYKYKLLETFKDNLTRQVDEGRRQGVMEDFQRKKRAIVLNSKLDFIKPFKTHVQIQTGNINTAPGRQDKIGDIFNEDRRQEAKMTDKPTNKRKADDENEEQADQMKRHMKKRKIQKLNSSNDFKTNIQRSSTPVPNDN